MIEMKVFRETTRDWTDKTPNHTYILSPDKQWMYGFIPIGKPASAVKMFSKRIQFSSRYRTFKEMKSK